MMNMMFFFEGQTVVATRTDADWEVVITDCKSNESKELTLSDHQFGAVLALMVAGDETEIDGLTDDTISNLYDIADPIFLHVPNYLRVIP